jgi:NADH-quinone oxidoreductase subunit G
MIEIEINGQALEVENGEKLISICDKQGIEVPRFCYHKDLSIAANCRMCLVDVEGNPKPQPACSTPVYAGMKVNTQNQKVKDSQQAVMEFLLINHPLDCPVCDQGGECELQDVAMNYGNGESFFSEGKRVASDSDIGNLIHTEMTRCIHCTRCVRFGDEVAGLSEMGMLGRGDSASIATFVGEAITSELSGNMIDVCPVGALTSKPAKFSIRSWQTTNHKSIARHDLLGSNISVQTFDDKIYRLTARENQDINFSWISDRDRFSYTSLESDNRLLKPKIKVEGIWSEVDWQTALDFAIKGLKNNIIINNQGNKLSTLTSKTATLEELYLMQKLTKAIGGSCEYRLEVDDLSTYSYLDSTIKIGEIENFKDIILIGTNPRFDEPMLNYRIRKASLNGAKISAFISVDSEFNYSIDKKIIDSGDFEKTINNLDLNENTLIILGSEIHQSSNISKINLSIQNSNAQILNITTSGNTISARKLDFMSSDIYNKNAYILFDLGLDDLTNKLQENIQNADFVISLNAFKGMEDLANVMLPIAGLYETSGSFINIDENLQSFASSANPPIEAKAGWKVLKVLADLLELKGFDFTSSLEVQSRAMIYEKTIDKIALVEDKKPNEVLNKDLYNSDEYVRHSKCLQTNLGVNNVE